MNRPSEAFCRSQAIWARIIGLRGNATAIAVPSRIDEVTEAATASGRNGSCCVSDDQRQSYPSASTLRAYAGIDFRSCVSMPTSSFTGLSSGQPEIW